VEWRPNLYKSANMQDQEYQAVNEALNDYFFRGRFEMLPVYLDLEGEAEAEVAAVLDIDQDELGDFIGLTAARSLRFDKADPYVDQAIWLRNWSTMGRHEPPPFTALLCALSIAAERMGADENFSPNNYSERQFELLGVRDPGSQQKLRQYAKSTRQFWRALNMWLSERDFQLGRPTARAVIGHWKYASFGLSQALVRDADRSRFTGLFEKYDLVPGEPVPDAEMTLLVHDWMTSHGPTGPTIWLRKLWKSNDLRPRVVSAALDAFEAWERTSGISNQGLRNRRLQWQIGFTGFPRKRARLSLAVLRGGQAERLEEMAASRTNQDELFLETGSDHGQHFLGPISAINLDMLLLQSRSFKGSESGTNYAYIAKPIIPLARSPDGPAYSEVSRISLFEEHAILCHEVWLKRVEAHLMKCARSGHDVLKAKDMPGIPEGWCILRGVEIVRPLESAHDNFHALSPIASTAAIACVEGLKLGHGTWHAAAPPTIEATSERAGSKLEIIREQFGKKDEVLVSVDAIGDVMEADLAKTDVKAGVNLRALVKIKSSELAETSLSLRSANMPRPLGIKRIYHPIVENEFASKTQQTHDENTTGLEGCLLRGQAKSGYLDPNADQARLQVEVPEGSQEVMPDLEWCHSHNAAEIANESCVIRGHHHWVYEPFEKDDDRFDAKMAECRNCRVRALSRTREVAKGNAKKMANNEVVIPSRRSMAPAISFPGKDESALVGVAPDTIFDGLCYLGQGSWASFQRLATAASPEPWFAHSLAGDLFSLGHLELSGTYHSLAADWSVPPPVLVIRGDGIGYLAGFQSVDLLEALNETLSAEGVRSEPVTMAGQLTFQRWSGLTGLDLEASLVGIKDPHGRPISVARGLSAAIAGCLPLLGVVWANAIPMHIEQSDGLAKFDTSRARWTRVDRLDGRGAYRVGVHGIRYVYRDAKGTTRQVGHQIAKILAARDEGRRLHGFDPATGQFTAALGVEPPGLFARAIVSSSGMLPIRKGGRLVYANVDPQVAATVMNKMYGKDESNA
jgi:hypothetical protein